MDAEAVDIQYSNTLILSFDVNTPELMDGFVSEGLSHPPNEAFQNPHYAPWIYRRFAADWEDKNAIELNDPHPSTLNLSSAINHNEAEGDDDDVMMMMETDDRPGTPQNKMQKERIHEQKISAESSFSSDESHYDITAAEVPKNLNRKEEFMIFARKAVKLFQKLHHFSYRAMLFFSRDFFSRSPTVRYQAMTTQIRL